MTQYDVRRYYFGLALVIFITRNVTTSSWHSPEKKISKNHVHVEMIDRFI